MEICVKKNAISFSWKAVREDEANTAWPEREKYGNGGKIDSISSCQKKLTKRKHTVYIMSSDARNQQAARKVKYVKC
jgi:hypothetical protein